MQSSGSRFTAMLLLTFGVGASVGPMLTGVLMRFVGASMLYVVVLVFNLIVAWRVQPGSPPSAQVDDARCAISRCRQATSSSPLAVGLSIAQRSR